MYYSVISWGSLLVRRQFLFPFPPRNPTRHNASRKCKTHAWGASDPSILPTKALALACFIGHVQAVFHDRPIRANVVTEFFCSAAIGILALPQGKYKRGNVSDSKR